MPRFRFFIRRADDRTGRDIRALLRSCRLCRREERLRYRSRGTDRGIHCADTSSMCGAPVSATILWIQRSLFFESIAHAGSGRAIPCRHGRRTW